MDTVLQHFKKNDPILYPYFLKYGVPEPIKKDLPNNYFLRLCRDILGQQLSGKASDAILKRFHSLFSNSQILPSEVLAIPHERLRGAGMSHAKARYVRNIAEAVENGLLPISKIDTMSDEEVIVELTRIKGVGPWTAEMFLIFTLGREDVFSQGDLGLRNAMKKIYPFKKEPTKKQVEKIVRRWSPYRSFASRILWMSLDNR